MSLGVRFVLLAAFALVLVIVDHREDHLSRARELLGLAVYPLQVAVDMPFSAWESVAESMADRRSLQLENNRLEAELRVARVRLQALNAIARENARLRQLLDADEQPGLDLRMAEILSVDLENRQRFLINRGTNDGVYLGQPLLDADGVVGQVMSVSRFTSEALLITDPSHRIHVALTSTGKRTIAQGTGDSGLLRLLYVPNEDDVNAGDMLVTTGYGGVFPDGRPVARVIDVQRQPGRNFASVLAEPVATLDRDQEVLLVWQEDSETTARIEERAVMAEPVR